MDSQKYGLQFQVPNHGNFDKLRSLTNMEFNWEWESCRTKEGFYKIQGGTEYALHRLKYFSDYADMLWVETGEPSYNQARQISEYMSIHHPDKFLCYNLSPSFNWSESKLSDEEMQKFILKLGKLGFSWTFITLAGFHINGLATRQFSEAFAKDGMLSYVKDIQRKEIELNMPLVKHQKWSGTSVSDKITELASGSSTTLSNGTACTESQFR